MTTKIPSWYIMRKDFIEDALEEYLTLYFQKEWIFLWTVDNKWLEKFREACFYSLKWWKKLRAILAIEFYLTLWDKTFEELSLDDDIVKYALAIEIIHSFSLVHDDLPCMDNDTLRRWKETTWKKYGEYQWLLIWDFLNTLAFELLTDIQNPKLAIQLIHLLSRSTWYHGMVWGQIDDMYFEENESDLNLWKLLKLHNRKTGALIRASVQGGILVSGKIQHIHKLSSFWEKLGLAFQIKDDILDVEGTALETGKSVWWEDKWFVHFLWITKSKTYLNDLIDDCYSTAKILKSERIDFLISFVKERSK